MSVFSKSKILQLISRKLAFSDPDPDHLPEGQERLPLSVITCVLDLTPVGILIARVDDGQALIYVNRAFEHITGYLSADALGRNCRYLQGSDRMQPQILEMREAIRQRTEVSVTLRNYRRDGRLFWNQLRLSPVLDRTGKPTHYVGLMQDMTHPKEAVDRLQSVLYLDHLTGALNRNASLEALSAMTAAPAALPMVVKIDIAGFHDVNTGFGYDIGDLLLKQVAERLQSLSPSLIGRLTADEFVLGFALTARAGAESKLAQLAAVLAPRYLLQGAAIHVRFSTGYTIGEPGSEALALLRKAGAAVKESRETKLREPRQFDERAEARSRNRIRLAAELQQAVQQQDFSLAFQPKVELSTGTIVGAEALLRWQHGLFGEQRPDIFIQLAEDTGLILDIGAWGLRAAIKFAARANHRRTRPLQFAFNISAVEFVHHDFVRYTAEALHDSGIDPAWLTLELTESLMVDSSPKLLEIFRSLRNLGVRLAIDDFGTGYSSLRYLSAFPVDEVKIDRSFVGGMCSHAANRHIVEAIIGLCRGLDIAVVAEGIESEAERAALTEMGCRHGQGFLFSRPVGEETFLGMVGTGAGTSAPPGARF